MIKSGCIWYSLLPITYVLCSGGVSLLLSNLNYSLQVFFLSNSALEGNFPCFASPLLRLDVVISCADNL